MKLTRISKRWTFLAQAAAVAFCALALVACDGGAGSDSAGSGGWGDAFCSGNCEVPKADAGSHESWDNAAQDTSGGGADSSGGGWWSYEDASVSADVSGWWSGVDSGGQTPDPGPDPDPDPEGCVPSCDMLQCGPDGCGGSCGWCSAQASCQEGVCVVVDGCTPDCGGAMIGADDGCGGVCSGGGFGIGLKPGGAQDVGYFRRLVRDGQVPEADLFPIEGFLNEHDTPLPPPNFERFVTLHAFLGLFFDPDTTEPLLAMQLGMNSGIDPAVLESKRFNLVVVVDTSGSMDRDDKMEFVKLGLTLMLDSLDENDTLGIVSYDGVAHVELSPVAVTDETRGQILEVIASLEPGGTTNLYDGMAMGYELAMRSITDTEAEHRIMLLSDGNPTAGNTLPEAILSKSASYNREGIGITTIGVGLDFNQELMYDLANQGGGNFYFLDDGAKLVEVFRNELTNLMTPVAENLQISFDLPPGFFVEAIYGFDYKEENGEVVLLGPSARYTAGPTDAPDPGQPGGGGGGDVAVSTLFASSENGLLMIKLGSEHWDVFSAWDAMDFATIRYQYDLVDRGATESAEEVVNLGSLSYFAEDDPGSGLAYFTGPIMQRNYCVLRAALAVRAACNLYHADPPELSSAITELADAITFCTAANFHLAVPDPELEADIQFLTDIKDNMCREMECLPDMGL